MTETKPLNKNGAIEMEADSAADAEEDPFQKVMERAGNHGRFQMIFNLVFIMGLAMAGAMLYMNIILSLNVPDHWCTVPGRERTNYSLDEWREITLPIRKDNRGEEKYSSCEMFDAKFTEIANWEKWNSTESANVTVCQNGWTYDKTWYESTIPTQENWVCEKDLYVTNTFVVSVVTESIGSFIFGPLGDILGRRPTYYFSVVVSSMGRIFSTLVTNSYTWFLIFTSMVGISIISMFTSPQIIGMEISREKDRSMNAIFQSFGWTAGNTAMPLLFWWMSEWKQFMLISSIPTALVLFLSYYVIESPRWLISKRRYGDAILQFKKIAKVNGRDFDMTEAELAQIYINQKPEVTYGFASLFGSWRLARNTSIMGFSWCVAAVSYFTLVLFSSRMGGNPFLNLLMQNIVEIPSYIVGKYLADKYGRRATNSVSFVSASIAFIPVIILATNKEYDNVLAVLAAFIKFLNGITFFTAKLQCLEIYPTCVRQTGLAFGGILANIVGIFAPYLVYLGTNVDIRYPYYILSLLFLLGGIAASFLPETLHKKLPDTMEEAHNFGRNVPYFSLPKAPVKHETTSEKLNQEKFAP